MVRATAAGCRRLAIPRAVSIATLRRARSTGHRPPPRGPPGAASFTRPHAPLCLPPIVRKSLPVRRPTRQPRLPEAGRQTTPAATTTDSSARIGRRPASQSLALQVGRGYRRLRSSVPGDTRASEMQSGRAIADAPSGRSGGRRKTTDPPHHRPHPPRPYGPLSSSRAQ